MNYIHDMGPDFVFVLIELRHLQKVVKFIYSNDVDVTRCRDEKDKSRSWKDICELCLVNVCVYVCMCCAVPGGSEFVETRKKRRRKTEFIRMVVENSDRERPNDPFSLSARPTIIHVDILMGRISCKTTLKIY